MGASPTSLSFDYQKNGTTPTGKDLAITPTDNSDYFGDGPWIDSKPYWLTVSKTSQTEKPAVARYKVTPIKAQIDNLGAGTHDAQIVFSMKRLSGRLDRVYVSVTIEIEAAPPPPNPEKVTFEYEPSSTDACGSINVRYTVEGGVEPYDLYKNGVIAYTGFTSPFVNAIPRNGQPIQIEIRDRNNNPISINGDLNPATKFNVIGVRKLNANDVTVNVRNYEAGSTVNISITYLNSSVSPYEYSLNGTDWQDESTFSDLPPDNYTLYIRDALGCVYTETFIVDGVTTVTETIFDISEINAMRYAKVDNDKKNYYNTLSFMENREIHNLYSQKWIDTDVIPTQFRTNANYINIYAFDCQGNETPLIPTQKTENIGQIGYSTATLFRSPNNRGALYFGLVNILDPNTSAVVDTIDFQSQLPDWIKVGQEIEVSGSGYAEVINVYFSSTYEAYVAELDFGYTAGSSERQVKATYNLQPYEVYEFLADMAVLPSKYQIVIQAGTDENNIKFTYISEAQQRFIDSEKYVRIDYYDEENRGKMNYQTGIKHMIRLEAYNDYQGEQTTEGYNGDEQYYKTDDEVYNTDTVVFPFLSSAMAHKLRLILAHNDLFLNGVGYKLSETPEIEGTLTTNHKQLTATFKLSGNEFIPSENANLIDTEGGGLAGIEAYNDLGLLLWTKNAQ
ncbi:hypothetical protein [Joostella sp. CR20]|uniref:hypothetical protein n=1 Tax=Joostella sp. CR20 TaxID=2804312 RepID=UPI00313C18FD